MQPLQAQSLLRQLLAGITLLVLPVLLGVAWSARATFIERRQEVGDEARLIAALAAAQIDRELRAVHRTLDALAADAAVAGMDAAAAAERLRRAGAGGSLLSHLMLVNAAGDVVASSGAGTATQKVPRQPWGADVSGSASRLTLLLAPAEPDAVGPVVIGAPVRDAAGMSVGAIGAFLDVDRLVGDLQKLPLPDGAAITVARDDRLVLASTITARPAAGQFEARPAAVDREAAAPREDADGVWRVYGEASIPAGPWIVGVGLPASLALVRTAPIWQRNVAVLALGVAGWLVLSLVFSRRLSRAVAHLSALSRRIASGDFSPIERTPAMSREFHEAQESFALMLEQFNATRRALDEHLAEERRVRHELERLQGQVIRQERLAAVGQLVSGVAHEINNPLQAILGFAELLQMQQDIPDTAKHDLGIIQKESARACAIIRNLATFARQQPAAADRISLCDVIGAVAELRQRRLESEEIELRIEDRATQAVTAVAVELQQVVLNFVINAEQAILASGRLPGCITIRTFDAGDQVALEVEDTGPGVLPEHQDHLFEPFFTTKPTGQGTGLGLSVSFGIIESLGGEIGYRAAPTGGAIFYFTIPAAR